MICFHGFYGSEWDLEFIKNHVYNYNDKIDFYAIRNTQEISHESLQNISNEAVLEIENYLDNDIMSNFTKLSFIGFSMGAIVARATLSKLQKYKKKFSFFLSLSSPHLSLVMC